MKPTYYADTGQKLSKQHPSWLWKVMLFKPCFSWKRCKHRKPCPVRRSTHAGASGGGGDGVSFAKRKKKFAGQQGLHSSVAAGRLSSGWNLPSFTLPCLCCSRAWNWVHPTGLGWNAEKMSVAGCQWNKRHCLRDPMTLDIKYVWGLLPNCSAQGLFSLSDGRHQDFTGRSFHYRQPWLCCGPRINCVTTTRPGGTPSLGTPKSQALLRPGRCVWSECIQGTLSGIGRILGRNL